MSNFYVATTKIFGNDIYSNYEYNILTGELLEIKEVYKNRVIVTSNTMINERNIKLYLEIDRKIFLESTEEMSKEIYKKRSQG